MSRILAPAIVALGMACGCGPVAADMARPPAGSGWGIVAELRIDGRPVNRWLLAYDTFRQCRDYALLLAERHRMTPPPECKPLGRIQKPQEEQS